LAGVDAFGLRGLCHRFSASGHASASAGPLQTGFSSTISADLAFALAVHAVFAATGAAFGLFRGKVLGKDREHPAQIRL
jgi:hypothetical protein